MIESNPQSNTYMEADKALVLAEYPDAKSAVSVATFGMSYITSKNGTRGVGGRVSPYCDNEADAWESAAAILKSREPEAVDVEK